MNESHLERLCLSWFRDSGWDVLYGPDLAPEGESPERSDYRDVLLRERLAAALSRLNPQLPDSAIEEAVTAIARPKQPSLVLNNREFHQALLKGLPVEVEDEGSRRGDRARLVDFEVPGNNEFLVVNQFTVLGTKQPRRPDLVCFLNGIPIAVIELKNPVDEGVGIEDAFNQLSTYKTEISQLFVYNEALVISDGINARVGSLTAGLDRFLPWRVVRNEDDRPLLEYELEKVVRGFFSPDLLLDYLRSFILFEDSDDGIVKKIAAYHQFHAVREALRVAVIAATGARKESVAERATYGKRVVPGSRKGGIVWHTQGSGKSITMAFFAGKLMREPRLANPTIVVVTDRNDLDGQLFGVFVGARELLGELPVQAESREQLRELLAGRESGGIYFTTVQKFVPEKGETSFPKLNGRSNIIVVADEAHRSQYGFKAVLDKQSGRYRYGFAKHLRDALPEATFVGFTGTPVEGGDRDTRAVFGDYVSIYDIQDAVDDKATVPIYYESRLAKLDLDEAEMEVLGAQIEDVFEDEEDTARREATLSRWAALEKIVGAKPRIESLAADIVSHFESRLGVIEGKGMIVCMSREICARLYEAIVDLRPSWHDSDPEKGLIKVVMTGSAADKEPIQSHVYNASTRKRLEKRFKSPSDSLKLVIVRDMWLTGFDVPCLHTMYVDKPMHDHNLMQAIARVNRVFGAKEGGLVVDYIGMAQALRNALKNYTESKGKGEPAHPAADALSALREKLEVARELIRGFDYSKYFGEAQELLIPAANYILGREEGAKRWADTILAASQAFSLCGTLDEAVAYREELAFFQAIKAIIAKAGSPTAATSANVKESVLRQILDNAVVVEGIHDVFSLAGLEHPDIGILSDDFLAEVRNYPQKNLAALLLERLMADQISSRARTNVVLEKKFADRLRETINRYHNRAIESAQVIEELIAMAKEFREATVRGEKLGLDESEFAFYEALANNDSAVRELGDEILSSIARELTEKLRGSASIDWRKRENVRARLRNLVRITLRRYKYPPDKQEEAVELVLNQAERLTDEWSADD
ncbi:MAG TPA: type I restriction endonuclease subunit R [Rectinemataceae bacterium]|nr:type I restriction endonuclease subunit R [Rectinemataceae bacterium]